MPELPEVETIRRQLDALILGRNVTSLTASWDKTLNWWGVDEQQVSGHQVDSVSRRGKVIIIALSSETSMLIHLRMTGQLLLDENRDLEGRLTRAVIGLASGQLVFNDQRKFGRIVVMPSNEVENDPLLRRLGPEPLSAEFTAQGLGACLARHRTASVKATLLDQSTLAGLGNIYVDEVLFTARLHPSTPSSVLTTREVKRLAEAIPQVLKAAIAAGGSTMRDYRDAAGASGTYLDQALVFGRTGKPCRTCGRAIAKIRVAGRGTHVCATCQRLRPR